MNSTGSQPYSSNDFPWWDEVVRSKPRIQKVLKSPKAYDGSTVAFTIPTEKICNHLGIAAEQMKDDAFSKIIRVLESSDSLDEINVDPDDHRAALLRKHLN